MGGTCGRNTLDIGGLSAVRTDDGWIIRALGPTPARDVTISFGLASYAVDEGGTTNVTVRLNAAPGRPVTVLVEAVRQGGAGEDDYSGVPDEVRFEADETENCFTVTATDDPDDDNEAIRIEFGDLLPDGIVRVGFATARAEVTLADNDDRPGGRCPRQCATGCIGNASDRLHG